MADAPSRFVSFGSAPSSSRTRISGTSADFAAIRTYAWLPAPPAPKSVASDSLQNPTLTQEVLGPHIIAAVDRQLQRRGLRPAALDSADIQVVYYAALRVGFDESFLGENYQYVTGWPSPIAPGLAPRTSMTVYEQGTIVVDIIQPAQKKAIWRATMRTRVNQENTLEKRIARIDDAVDRAFERFPIRQQK